MSAEHTSIMPVPRLVSPDRRRKQGIPPPEDPDGNEVTMTGKVPPAPGFRKKWSHAPRYVALVGSLSIFGYGTYRTIEYHDRFTRNQVERIHEYEVASMTTVNRDRAMSARRRALELDPLLISEELLSEAEAIMQKAEGFRLNKDHESARDAYDRATAVFKDNIAYAATMARYLEEQSRFNDLYADPEKRVLLNLHEREGSAMADLMRRAEQSRTSPAEGAKLYQEAIDLFDRIIIAKKETIEQTRPAHLDAKQNELSFVKPAIRSEQKMVQPFPALPSAVPDNPWTIRPGVSASMQYIVTVQRQYLVETYLSSEEASKGDYDLYTSFSRGKRGVAALMKTEYGRYEKITSGKGGYIRHLYEVRTDDLPAFYADGGNVEMGTWSCFSGRVVEDKKEGIEKYDPVYAAYLDAVLWCNSRSLKEGLQPVYRVQISEVKGWTVDRHTASRFISSIQAMPLANGYRLPTEEEFARMHSNTPFYHVHRDNQAVQWGSRAEWVWQHQTDYRPGERGPGRVKVIKRDVRNEDLYEHQGHPILNGPVRAAVYTTSEVVPLDQKRFKIRCVRNAAS